MSRESALTSEIISERLEGLRGLHRLGLSLLEAEGPPISRTVFYNRSLAVEGLVAPRTLALVASGLPIPPTEREVTVFASSSAAHQVGREFDVLLPHFEPARAQAARCILVGVTQQYGLPLNEIPAGWKTICRLRFPEGIPALVRELPSLESWDAHRRLLLSTSADLRRFRGRSADAG